MASNPASSTTNTDSVDTKCDKEIPTEKTVSHASVLLDNSHASGSEDEPAVKKIKLSANRPLFSRTHEQPEQTKKRLEKMCGAVKTLLECVGEDPDREGLLATPARYARALLFLTQGHQLKIQDIFNSALFHEGHHGMVIVKDIEIYSLCEHHLLPFTGKMHIGYISSDTVIGLSKLPRIAQIFSRRLQIQERLTNKVAQAIMEVLNPKGVAVAMESCHLCMVMRGVEKTGTATITSSVLGCFEESKTRSEFLNLVGVCTSRL